jgi:hypothetical protein
MRLLTLVAVAAAVFAGCGEVTTLDASGPEAAAGAAGGEAGPGGSAGGGDAADASGGAGGGAGGAGGAGGVAWVACAALGYRDVQARGVCPASSCSVCEGNKGSGPGMTSRCTATPEAGPALYCVTDCATVCP